MIAFESMNHWNDDGSFALHVFHKNNEMAGYCSVLHALQLIGITGNYGRGTFTFYGGHDPEDYQHAVNDPPTDLALHKNSPGYRLILNNILFPSAKKKKQKT